MLEDLTTNQTKGRISISDLSFRYEKNDFDTLKSFNLEIYPGEAISLVGPSGCGKSTLTKLISGLLQPDEGEV